MWHGSQERLAQHLCPHKPQIIAPGEAVWERETILGKHQILFVCLLAQKLARVTGVGLQASDRAVSTVHSCGACRHHKHLCISMWQQEPKRLNRTSLASSDTQNNVWMFRGCSCCRRGMKSWMWCLQLGNRLPPQSTGQQWLVYSLAHLFKTFLHKTAIISWCMCATATFLPILLPTRRDVPGYPRHYPKLPAGRAFCCLYNFPRVKMPGVSFQAGHNLCS